MCTGMCLPKMCAKAGRSVWELLEDRQHPGPRAGRGHTPPHGRQHAQAGAWGAQPAAPRSQPPGSAQSEAGEGKRERRRLGGRCWHLSTGTDERSSTCRCAHRAKAHPGSQGLPHPCIRTHRPGEGHRPDAASSLLCQGHMQHSTQKGKEKGQLPPFPSLEPLLRAGCECGSLLPFSMSAP